MLTLILTDSKYGMPQVHKMCDLFSADMYLSTALKSEITTELIACNEMEGGFEKGTAMFKLTSFNRKE